MGRAGMVGLAVCICGGPGWAQADERVSGSDSASSITVLGVTNPLLVEGTDKIRHGDYDEGIRLIRQGLEQESPDLRNRAAALSNLCAAYAAKKMPDAAIEQCTESLQISNENWQAYSNRAYAYWLKGMYAEASLDVDAATALSPKARQVMQIRGMINEAGLRPRVSVEEHQ